VAEQIQRMGVADTQTVLFWVSSSFSIRIIPSILSLALWIEHSKLPTPEIMKKMNAKKIPLSQKKKKKK
jgi:hypothetical protein